MEQSMQYRLWMYEEIQAIKENKLYLVRQRQTQQIALKRLVRPELLPIYQALQEMKNVHIPKVIEIIRLGNILYIIQEYVQGESLQALLEEGREFTEKETRSIGAQLCEALQTLHNHKPAVIHRDIKPGNVIWNSDGIVKLIDFDAARLYNPQAKNDTEYIGTQGYAAPEQYGFAQSDERSDIFAIGVLLAKLCPTPDAGLKRVVEKCTNMDPSRRYQNAVTLKHALQKKTIQKPLAIGGIICVILLVVALLWSPRIEWQETPYSMPQTSVEEEINNRYTPEFDKFQGTWVAEMEEGYGHSTIEFSLGEDNRMFVSMMISIYDEETGTEVVSALNPVPCQILESGNEFLFYYDATDESGGNSGKGIITYSYLTQDNIDFLKVAFFETDNVTEENITRVGSCFYDIHY